MAEKACTKCLWTGESDNHYDKCPKCGANIEYVDNSLPQQEFNWNKK